MSRFMYLALLPALFHYAAAQTTLYSQLSGPWNTPNLWNTDPAGAGTYVTDPNTGAYNIVVQSGHAVVLHTTRAAGSLDVQNGASLDAGGSTLKYLELYGASVQIDGVAGGPADGLSFDVNGPACVISGNGTINLSRLRKDNDPGSAPTTTLSINADITLHYDADSRTALCNLAIGKNLHTTVEAGRSVTVSSGNVGIDGNDGSNSVNHGGSLTVKGTLQLNGSSGHLYLTTDNSASFPVSCSIHAGGQVQVGGNLYGNAPGGPAVASLSILNGGVLTLSGNVLNWQAGKNSISLASGSLVEYVGYNYQEIEPQWPYADLLVSGSEKYLSGNTGVSGTLTLDGTGITLGFYDVRIEDGGQVAGGGPYSYLRTDDIGMLRQYCGNTALWYPVGNSAYNPVRLRNSGAYDAIGVRVADELLTEGYIGIPMAAEAVDRSWFLEEDAPGGSLLEAVAQWSASHELSGFNRAACRLAFFKYNDWNTGSAGPAQGGNPYTRTRGGMADPEILAVVSGQTLPVEWLSFEAVVSGQSVVLRWETASAHQHAGFRVERSGSGGGFVPVGSVVDALGVGAYTFVDQPPGAGAFFYRIRQEDVDGGFRFSPIRQVTVGAGAPLRLFPVPADERLTVILPEKTSDGHWEVIGASGRVVDSGALEAEQDRFQCPVGRLAHGTYTLCVWSDRQLWTAVFMR